MKICFLAHNGNSDNGGGVLVSRVVNGLRNSLAADVVVLTTVPSGAPGEQPILYPNKWRMFFQLWRIRRIFKSADVIHAFDVYPYGIIIALLSWGLKKRVIVTAVGTGSILPLYHTVQAFFARIAYRRADYVVAISRFTRDEVLKKVSGLAIAVINPGIDAEEFQKKQPDAGLETRLDSVKPYILSVGALRKRKGYELSIPAFAEVSRKFPDLRYVIVGKALNPDYKRRLEHLARDLGVGERVVFLDTIDTREALYTVYRHAELFCLFSRNEGHDVEGFGIVFLEAAAFGLPVVGTKGCGIDDAARDGENGTLVAENDVAGFARAVSAILSDHGKKNFMGERSLKFAIASDWQKGMEEYNKIYKQLADGK